MNPTELMRRLALPRERKTKRAPTVCKFCSRKHSKDDYCKLFLRKRQAKSGRIVRRWAP